LWRASTREPAVLDFEIMQLDPCTGHLNAHRTGGDGAPPGYCHARP
jgi:hypothetical protein